MPLCISSGEVITDENEEIDEKTGSICTKYRLVGVVVHSGQASGGHYYSYILHRYGVVTVSFTNDVKSMWSMMTIFLKWLLVESKS